MQQMQLFASCIYSKKVKVISLTFFHFAVVDFKPLPMEIKKNSYRPNQRFGFTDLAGASEITGLSKSSLYKLCSQRKVPHYKPTNGRLLFKVEELLAWIEQSALQVVS
jgi:excisionase family DNA binding protein